MNVLLTGSAGFIGSHIAAALTAAGHRVRGLDARPDGLGGPPADVRDAEAVARRLAGVDAVCHQAAKVGLGQPRVRPARLHLRQRAGHRRAAGRDGPPASPSWCWRPPWWCTGRRLRLRAARPRPAAAPPEDAARRALRTRLPRLRSPHARRRRRETPADPRNVYADTKLAQEHLAASWARATGGSAAALRHHNVYGPRMPRDPLRGRRGDLPVPAAGRAGAAGVRGRRAAPRLRARPRRRPRQRAGAGAGRGRAARARRAARLQHRQRRAPHHRRDGGRARRGVRRTEPRVTGGYRLGDVRHIVARPDRARRELGFSPAVAFADGMAEFARTPVTSS